MNPRDDDHWFGNDALQPEDGVLVPANEGHKVGGGEDQRAPDEYVEDPVNEPGVPGTVDDLPYDYGVETPQAADETLDNFDGPHLGSWSVGATGPADEGEPQPLGAPEERELWQKQRHLIEEADASEREYAGLDEKDIPGIMAASGEDAEDVLSETPGGLSATGSESE